MKDYLKNNERTLIFTTAVLFTTAAVAWFALAMFALSGCSTVSGFAKDLGDASEGLREAMTKEP